MQFDIKCVGAWAHGDHFAHFKLAVQHHGPGLHVRQRVGAQGEGGGRHIAQAVFNRFVQIGVQWIAVAHLTFLARQNTNTAVDPFAGAGPEELDAVQPDFNVYPAVNHKFAVAVYQIPVLRIDGDGESDAFFRQLAFQNLADLHAVQNQRLTGFDTVAFRCRQGQCHYTRFLQ
ncbi:hypothetical protein D3C72_1132310 [compost metagenome]